MIISNVRDVQTIDFIMFLEVFSKKLVFSDLCMNGVLNTKNKLPPDMKKGILNFPDITTALSDCIVGPSNGKTPHTNTYNTTPRLCKSYLRYIDEKRVVQLIFQLYLKQSSITQISALGPS